MRTGTNRHSLNALGIAWMLVVAAAVPALAQQPEPSHTLIRPGLIDAHSHLFLHPYDETLWDDQVLKEARAYRTLMAGVNAERTLLSGFTLLRDLGSEGAGWAEISSLDSPSVAGDLHKITTQLSERIQ